MSDLEILGPGSNDRRRMQIASAVGIQARVRFEDPSFVYELRVPYGSDAGLPLSIRAASGTQIGVGLETPDIDSPSSSFSSSSGGAGGGGRGGRGGRGGGGSGSSGSESERPQQTIEPLRDWMVVQLVSPDSVKTK